MGFYSPIVELFKVYNDLEGTEMIEKPPIGLTPRFIHDQHRTTEIGEAIIRYLQGDYPIPIEWVEEYNELLGKGYTRKGAEVE